MLQGPKLGVQAVRVQSILRRPERPRALFSELVGAIKKKRDKLSVRRSQESRWNRLQPLPTAKIDSFISQVLGWIKLEPSLLRFFGRGSVLPPNYHWLTNEQNLPWLNKIVPAVFVLVFPSRAVPHPSCLPEWESKCNLPKQMDYYTCTLPL